MLFQKPFYSDGSFAISIEIPISPPPSPDLAPRIRGTFISRNDHSHLGDGTFLNTIVTSIGLYSVIDLQPQEIGPFHRDNAASFLSGNCNTEWAIFRVEVGAYQIHLEYYCIANPDKRGTITIGRWFTDIEFTFTVVDHYLDLQTRARGAGSDPKTDWGTLRWMEHLSQNDCHAFYHVHLHRESFVRKTWFGLGTQRGSKCTAIVTRKLLGRGSAMAAYFLPIDRPVSVTFTGRDLYYLDLDAK